MLKCKIQNSVTSNGLVYSTVSGEGISVQAYNKMNKFDNLCDYGVNAIVLWLNSFSEFSSVCVGRGIGTVHNQLQKLGYKLVKGNFSRSGKSFEINVIKA